MEEELVTTLTDLPTGRGLGAERNFQKYSTIFKDRVVFGAIEETNLDLLCSYCLRKPVKFTPKKCANCRILSYCSERCQVSEHLYFL